MASIFKYKRVLQNALKLVVTCVGDWVDIFYINISILQQILLYYISCENSMQLSVNGVAIILCILFTMVVCCCVCLVPILSPVYVHFLRRPRGLVVGDLSRNAEGDDEGYDATRDVNCRVGLVGARVVRLAGRGR